MEISTAATALIGLLGGVFGVLIGAYLSSRASSQLERKKETNYRFVYAVFIARICNCKK